MNHVCRLERSVIHACVTVTRDVMMAHGVNACVKQGLLAILD